MRALRNAVRPLILATLLLPGAHSAVHAQAGKLLPGDEAVQDAELFAFRARLQAAVARHDTAAVLEVVDPNIKNTFGGDDGSPPSGASGSWRPGTTAGSGTSSASCSPWAAPSSTTTTPS